MGYAMNAVSGLRPFLDPFYSWTASLPGGAFGRPPIMLRVTSIFLVDEIGVMNLTRDFKLLAAMRRTINFK
eukprot:11223135-Karenia_brevis.AAC.1